MFSNLYKGLLVTNLMLQLQWMDQQTHASNLVVWLMRNGLQDSMPQCLE